jgi:aminoglycoside phosphotransferase (APT) family kinase protein
VSPAGDVVATAERARTLDQEPLIILEPLQGFLDEIGLGSGPLSARPIGAGHSNVTYALERGGQRFVLRRPPRGPLAPSTHDVLREARLLRALAATDVPVPDVLAVCETPHVIGVPFYVMDHLDGHVLDRELPPALAEDGHGARIAEHLVDTLARLHAVDITDRALSSFGPSDGYLERQLRRFRALLAQNATRPLPELERVAEWLADNRPLHSDRAVVHGDYRLGNVMLATDPPARIVAVLDWEMATLGDPIADVAYLTATWAEAGDPADPMLDLCHVTRSPGFPDRDALLDRYAQRTGRDLTHLRWYQALALWKAAIFLEGSYGRHLAGTTADPFFASLREGVPTLARRAAQIADGRNA